MDPTLLGNALEKKCENYNWLAWILFLTSSSILFNSSHLISYVFLGGSPSFFCNVLYVMELFDANWTKEQIREISSPGYGTIIIYLQLSQFLINIIDYYKLNNIIDVYFVYKLHINEYEYC